MSEKMPLARREGQVIAEQSTFDLTSMQAMADKIKDLKAFMDKNLEQGVTKDWEYAHIIWRRPAPADQRDVKPCLLDPGVAKIMNFMTVRPRHRIIEKEIDPKTMQLRYVIAVEIVPFLPVMYYNPVENRMEQVFPVIAEGLGSATTREKRYKVRFEWMKERDLKVEGWTEDELKKYVEEHPDMFRAKADPKYDNLYFMPTAESLGLDNTLLKMAAKRCLGSTTPVLVKSERHVSRMNLSNLYDLYNACVEPVYLPGRNGEWRMITGIVREENRKVLSIKLRSGESLRPTEEHEFPTSEGNLKPVRELKVGDKLIRSHIGLSTPEGGGADPRYGWAVGLFIAEGEFQNESRSVRYTLHEKETEYIDKLEVVARSLGSALSVHPRKGLKCVFVTIFGHAFSGLMSQFVNGDSCYNKTLSKFAWDQGEDFLREVLQGYLDGDSWESHRRKTPKWPLGFTGENYELQHDLRCLCAILGKRVRITRTNAKLRDKIYSAFRGWITDTVDSYNQAKLEEIESIEPETKPAVVYDIDVDGDDIFLLASGIESHNSALDAVFQLPGVAGRYSQEIDLKEDRGELASPTASAEKPAPPEKLPLKPETQTAPKQPQPEAIYPPATLNMINMLMEQFKISREEVIRRMYEIARIAPGPSFDEALLKVQEDLYKEKSAKVPPSEEKTIGEFMPASELPVMPPDFKLSEEASYVADYIMTNFDKPIESVRAMIYGEMAKAAGLLTDVAAAKLVQSSFEERSKPVEETKESAQDEISDALEDAGLDGSMIEAQEDGSLMTKMRADGKRVFLGDIWGKYTSVLNGLGYHWVKEGVKSRWERDQGV